MAKLWKSLETKSIEGDPTGPPRWLGVANRTATPGQAPWSNWSTAKAVTDAYEREPYVFRAIHQLAVAVSSLPIVLRENDPYFGKIVDTTEDPLLQLLNHNANALETGGDLRYRIVTLMQLSKRGVMIERVKSIGGTLLGLHILPADATKPIPPTPEQLLINPNLLVSTWRVQLPGLPPYDVPPEDVCWVRWPHPLDPYSGVTPIEPLGLTIDTSFYGRLYNRRFLGRDGRPGGVLAIKGRLSPDETQALERRYGAGIDNAGVTSVLSADDVSYVDTGSKPRDMSYSQLWKNMKDEELAGIGTPESIAGNASGRTFDNADAERENWYIDDVLPTGNRINQALSIWTAGGAADGHVLGFDTSHVAVLQRFERERLAFALQEFMAMARTQTEYRDMAGMPALTRPEMQDLFSGIITRVAEALDAQPVADGGGAGGGGGFNALSGTAGDPAAGKGRIGMLPRLPGGSSLTGSKGLLVVLHELGLIDASSLLQETIDVKSEPPPFAPSGRAIEAFIRARVKPRAKPRLEDLLS